MLLRDVLKGHRGLYNLTSDGFVDESIPVNENTTQGNVGRLEQTTYQGIAITIENDVGSIREGTKPNGQPFSTTFYHAYGYINNTKGADGEEIDCFIGPNPYSNMVYIIHQSIGGKYDEDKVVFGCDEEEQAKMLYLAHFDTQSYLGPITAMSVPEFKLKVVLHDEGKLL